jgi:HEAT repeat protein
LDQDTRRQITWIVIITLVLSVVVLVAHRRTEVDSLLKIIAERPPEARISAVARLVEQQKLALALEDQPRWVQDRAVEAAAAVGTESALQQLVAVKPLVDAPVAARIDALFVSLSERAVGPLVLALQDKDAAVRGAAGAPLRAIGEPAVASLMPLIDVYDDAVRGLVATTLGGIGEPAVVPLLRVMKQAEPAFDQGPAAFRRSKTAGLAAFKAMGETALDPVIDELLDHEDPEVRLAAADILGTVAALLDEEKGRRVVPPLIERLTEDSAWPVRRKAASAIGGLGDTAITNGAVQPLIARLDDRRPEVRASAAAALGTLRAPEAAQPLATLLRTNRIGATAEIATALERIGPPAIAPLTPALEHPEVDVRLTATQTLAVIGTSESVLPLGRALTDAEVKVRRAAAGALRNLGDERVLPQLATALGDADAAVYYAARDALARLGRPAIPVLVQRLGSENTRIAYVAQQALARIGEAAVEPLVNTMRTSPDPETVRWAAIALGQIGADAVEPAAALLADRGARVEARVGAARALGTTGSNAATEPLKAAVQSAPAPVREQAIRGLGQIGDERATDALVEALADSIASVRETAMQVLINWRLGDVDQMLTTLLEGDDENAARRAAIILAEHTPAASGELIRAVGTVDTDVPGERETVRIRLEETVEDPASSSRLRLMAISALQWVGTEASLDALGARLAVGSDYAEAASRAIGHIGQRLAQAEEGRLRLGEEVKPSQASELLIGVFDTADSEELRFIAAAGLAVMGGQPVDLLVTMLREETDPRERTWLIATLAAIGKPAVDPILDARGRTGDRTERDWLASALVLIGDARAMDMIKQLPEDEQPDPEKIRAGREIFRRILERM